MPEVRILELAGGGAGLARHEGRVWLVRGALPGEIVEAVEERRRAGIVEGRTVRVVQPGAWRDPEPCPAAGLCGGCDLANVRREAVAEALRQVVRGALRHAAPALAEAVEGAPVAVSPPGWRLRARLQWDRSSARLGFFAPRSHHVADIAPCRVLAPRLAAARPRLAAALGSAGIPDGQLEWVEDLEGAHAVAGWIGPGAPPRGPVEGVDGWHPLNREGAVRAGGWGRRTVTMRLPLPLEVPVGVFFQGNRHLAPKLWERVAGMVRQLAPKRVVDLYGGVGFLGAAARHAGVGELVVVESQPPAARAAAHNLPGAEVVPATAEAFLAAPPPRGGTLAIVDPPREGLSRLARRQLLAWRPAAVLALACDPAAGGRDLGTLLGAGYALAALELWDMFGGSHHAEMVAFLVDTAA
ncbi:MAG TPA: hypothetical protein P5234_02070 [Thermoanaerobaculaceae bacterium]|nr:hypothetical protein [Thermoanaerobaculaceae bacterium]HRS15015.1 hypothetical protein [Thermoanaerobaculaceae bacterium]